MPSWDDSLLVKFKVPPVRIALATLAAAATCPGQFAFDPRVVALQ
jgi:hypothetical protein